MTMRIIDRPQSEAPPTPRPGDWYINDDDEICMVNDEGDHHRLNHSGVWYKRHRNGTFPVKRILRLGDRVTFECTDTPC